MVRSLTIFLLWAAPLLGQDARAALERAERTYQTLSTLTAEYRQTLVNPMLGGPEQSRGLLFLAPPSRFAMRFTEPEGERIVADGQSLWLYAPSSAPRQVIRRPIPRGGMASPNLMAQFVDRPFDRYDVEYAGVDTLSGTVVDVVTLRPQDRGLGFTVAQIAIARSDGLLRRIAITEVSGQRRTLVFDRLRANIPIAADELRFDIPTGVRVVQP
jgi:outer membrane lipoprotein carrier protein